jgi:hypothetical protein
LLAGVARVFFETSYQVYVPSLLDAGRLAEGNARLHGSEAAAQVAGPGAGGLIAQLFGAVAGIVADAVTFAVSAACLLAIRHRDARRAAPPRRSMGVRSAKGCGS